MGSRNLTRYHVPAAILVLVGLGLLVVSGALVLDLVTQEREYSIEPVDEEAWDERVLEATNEGLDPAHEEHMRIYSGSEYVAHHEFSELSDDGQRAVAEAVASDDGQVTVSGERNFVEEFTPHDEVHSYSHFVRYDGQYYLLTAHSQETHGLEATYVFSAAIALGFFALFLVGAGGVGFFLSHPLFTMAVVAGLGYPGSKYVLSRAGILSMGPTPAELLVASPFLTAIAYGLLE